MTYMKGLFIQCDECGWNDEVDNSDPNFDKYYNLEDDEPCPGCKKDLAKAV